MVSCGTVKVKVRALLVPSALVTVSGPVVAPTGTTTVRPVAVLPLMAVVVVPLKLTLVAPARLLPLTTMLLPTTPLLGVSRVMAGAAARLTTTALLR